ncbi:MAG: DinB family protein [Candidatus Heimdallarchaeota archaeon]|nr:DinB family protein [Candidatus Heimdallarchaeota archaeon]
MDHIKLFQDVVYRRSVLLKGFEKVDRDLFQKSVEYESWSPESLFRHLLTGMKWISGVISKEPIAVHPLALMTAAQLDHNVSLAGVKVALDKTTQQLQEQILQVTDEEWKEIIDTPLRGKIPREDAYMSLLYHELEHIGQIKWLLKRLTGWTDSEIYAIRIERE